MPPSTRRPGRRLRSTAALPTPFCRLTMTASGGACLRDDVGHGGGIRALDRDQHHAGIARRSKDFPTTRTRSHAMVWSNPSKLVGRRPLASISAITRGRASSATRRPPAASMPPTKQPMLPAPAMPIVRPAIISIVTALHGLSIAERAAGAYRARRPGRAAPCNRHRPPLCFDAGLHGGDDHGFTRRTQRHAERPTRPEHPQRTIR